jgi:hypothetical protein
MKMAFCLMFEKVGVAGLTGKKLIDCHPGCSRQ